MSRETRFGWLSRRFSLRRKSVTPHQAAVFKGRPLRIEPLEDRRLLAVFTVTNDDDAGAGSLRQAILDANAAGGADQIVFSSVTGTIPLASQLLITDSVTITGPGAQLLTIVQTTLGSRVLNVDDGNFIADKNVALSGLTLTGGRTSGVSFLNTGGGIRSWEHLSITASVITGNSSAGVAGGGIYQYNGTLAISTSTISGNSATSGGGIRISGATATIDSSTISGNTATAGVQIGGGGVAISSAGSLTITGSTISGNTANDQGGGINNFSSTLVVRHSTITGNRNDANSSGFGAGGGIFTNSGATLDHVIVAGNFDGGAAARDDLSGVYTAAFSLIGDRAGTALFEAPVGAPDGSGNLIGGPTNGAIDPLLTLLADHSGPTMTHALLAGSPAIDAGNPAIVSPPATDQRGAPFARIVNGGSGARIDIGAYERQTLTGLNLVVDSLADENDGNFSAGDLSLREAIGLANGSAGANTITFAAALSGQTITLSAGELVLTEAIVIDATALAASLTIDAHLSSRIFHISALAGDFSLSGLTLTRGVTRGDNAPGFTHTYDGGAIRSLTSGQLTLSETIVSVSGTEGTGAKGGGIAASGSVTLIQTTVSGNFTLAQSAHGGGVFVNGALTLDQSTISGNSTIGTSSRGGGIAATSVALTASTVRGNSTMGMSSRGGGIFASGAVTLSGSSLSGNLTEGTGAPGGGAFSYGDVTLNQSSVGSNHTLGNGAQGGAISAVNVMLTETNLGGNSTGGLDSNGGGISASGSVTLTASIVSANATKGRNSQGGGIFASGAVTLTDTTVFVNTTQGVAAFGGGISAGSVALTRSTINGNSTEGTDAFGGGIFSNGGAMLNRSTVNGNRATGSANGGGILARGGVNLTQSTVSGNTSHGTRGGGIYSFGSVALIQSTVVDNHAVGNLARGGGMFGNSAQLMFIFGSIVAGNTAVAGNYDLQTFGELAVNYSLISNTSDTSITESTGAGNLLNIVSPVVGPLADNGGPTRTRALLPGSPAINAGDPFAAPGGDSPYDQRGFPFARIVGGRIDMGAVERGAVSADFDVDADIDGADFLIWQRGLGATPPNVFNRHGDADVDRDVDGADLAIWKSQFGIPPPSLAAATASLELAPAAEAEADGPNGVDRSASVVVTPDDLIDMAMAHFARPLPAKKATARSPLRPSYPR